MSYRTELWQNGIHRVFDTEGHVLGLFWQSEAAESELWAYRWDNTSHAARSRQEAIDAIGRHFGENPGFSMTLG